MQMTSTSSLPSYEPTLSDVVRSLWQARFYLLVGLIVGIVTAYAFVSAAVPQYRATMLVTPTTRSGTPDISALFPNNASFAMEYVMQSFGPGDSSDFMRFETILREASVAEVLLQDKKIKAGMMAAQKYKFSEGHALSSGPEFAAWLQKNISIESVGQTRLRRIVLRHPDPEFSVYFLQRLYSAADNMIRAELEDKTDKRLSYLTRTIDNTKHPDHKRVLTKLLMDQEQIRMILAVNEPFAAMVAEPPAASPKPAWPRKSVVFPVFIFSGLFILYLIYAIRR